MSAKRAGLLVSVTVAFAAVGGCGGDGARETPTAATTPSAAATATAPAVQADPAAVARACEAIRALDAGVRRHVAEAAKPQEARQATVTDLALAFVEERRGFEQISEIIPPPLREPVAAVAPTVDRLRSELLRGAEPESGGRTAPEGLSMYERAVSEALSLCP